MGKRQYYVVGGQAMTVSEIARVAGVTRVAVWQRLQRGWAPEECVKRDQRGLRSPKPKYTLAGKPMYLRDIESALYLSIPALTDRAKKSGRGMQWEIDEEWRRQHEAREG